MSFGTFGRTAPVLASQEMRAVIMRSSVCAPESSIDGMRLPCSHIAYVCNAERGPSRLRRVRLYVSRFCEVCGLMTVSPMINGSFRSASGDTTMNVLLGQSKRTMLARRAMMAPRRPSPWCGWPLMTAVPLDGADAVRVKRS